MKYLRNSLFILFFLNQVFTCIWAQDTYSRSFDLNIGLDNSPLSMLLRSEDLLVTAHHQTGMDFIISSISTFGYDGTYVASDTLHDFIMGAQFPLIKTEEGYELMGTKTKADEFRARGMYLIKFDQELAFLEKRLFYYEKFFFSNPRGFWSTNNKKVVYAGLVNNELNNSQGYIGFFDEKEDNISKQLVLTDTALPYSKYFINSFQETKDGNFAFIRWVWQRDTFPGLRFEVVQMNMEGEELGKISGSTSQEEPGLIQDDKDDFYFYTRNTPFSNGTIYSDNSLGGIAKANNSLDSVIWSFPLNENATIQNPGVHNHLSFGFTNLSDGNLLTYGEASHFYQNNFAGYLCKFSKEGEIIWRHYYNVEVDSMFLTENPSGYKTAGVKQCQELDDGRILCLGTTIFNRADTLPQREIWLLLVDKNGCVYDKCQTSIELPVSTRFAPSTQEGKIYPNPVYNELHVSDVDFDTYEIHNLIGQLKQSGNFTTKISLHHQLPPGMYVLLLKEKGRLKSVFKFFKAERR